MLRFAASNGGVAQSGMVGQRAAANLVFRNNDVIARRIQQTNRRTVDRTQHRVHDASRKERDSPDTFAFRRIGLVSIATPLSIGRLRHQRFGFRHTRREKLQQARSPGPAACSPVCW